MEKLLALAIEYKKELLPRDAEMRRKYIIKNFAPNDDKANHQLIKKS